MTSQDTAARGEAHSITHTHIISQTRQVDQCTETFVSEVRDQDQDHDAGDEPGFTYRVRDAYNSGAYDRVHEIGALVPKIPACFFGRSMLYTCREWRATAALAWW